MKRMKNEVRVLFLFVQFTHYSFVIEQRENNTHFFHLILVVVGCEEDRMKVSWLSFHFTFTMEWRARVREENERGRKAWKVKRKKPRTKRPNLIRNKHAFSSLPCFISIKYGPFPFIHPFPPVNPQSTVNGQLYPKWLGSVVWLIKFN